LTSNGRSGGLAGGIERDLFHTRLGLPQPAPRSGLERLAAFVDSHGLFQWNLAFFRAGLTIDSSSSIARLEGQAADVGAVDSAM